MLIEKNQLKERVEEMYQASLIDEQPELISAEKLLTWNRLDLAFKIFYLKHKDKDSSFPQELYYSHIKAFTLGSFREPGNPQKNSYESYKNTFEEIYTSIEENGFNGEISIIPVSKNRTILNGAHRISAATLFGKQVVVSKTRLPDEQYDWVFFRDRGVPIEHIEAAASSFITYNKETYIAVLWPRSAQDHETISKQIPNIIYKKKITLSHRGIHNLLSICYKTEKWLGKQADDFPGIANKLSEVYVPEKDLTIIAFHASDATDVIKLKNEIRLISNLEKHSLHITDTHEEAKELSELLFNLNGLHFLNYAYPNRFCSLSEKIAAVKNLEISADELLIDSSTTLELYGLRMARDVDVICKQNVTRHINGIQISSHNDELCHHRISVDELIYNPKYYILFSGLKFVSPEQLKKFKTHRGEEKDQTDIALLNKVLTQAQSSFKAKLEQSYYYYRTKAKLKLRKNIIIILKILRIHAPLKRIINRMKPSS